MPLIAQFDRPNLTWEPSDDLRGFVFLANLAAQEACGDPAASVSVERVHTRLQGTAESDSLLLALVEDGQVDPQAPRSSLGLPLLPSSVPADLIGEPPVHEIFGFTHLALPLREERDVIEFEIVLDAEYLPLPGEELSDKAREVIGTLVEAVVTTAHRLRRHVLQLWLVHPLGQRPGTGPLAEALSALGFELALAEEQSVLPVPGDRPAGEPAPGMRVEVLSDYEVPPQLVDDVLDLLSDASVDVPHGSLAFERVEWTPSRLAEAAARLKDRGGRHLLVLLVDADGRAVALTEFMEHAGSTPGVLEQGVTFVAAERRGEGLGMAVKRWGLSAVAEAWPQSRRVYTSNPTGHPAILRINAALGAEAVSASSAWQRVLR